jgi:energy-converting hydrogenase Eha subunit A
VAGAAGFAVLPFARIGRPLADALPWQGSWLVAAVFGAPAIAALMTAARTRSSDQSVIAVACAGAIAALTVALLGIAAIILFPHSVPDIVGSALPPGTPAAVRQAENATEASDPYWGFLAFGGLLALLFWATSRPPQTRDLARLLLACLAAPAVALAFAGGAGTIALATAAVVLVAVARARRGAVAAT